MEKETINNSGFIGIDDLADGMKLFYKGTSDHAHRIHRAQKRRFGDYDNLYLLNHVGDIIINKDGNAVCYEQDGWGKFGTSLIDVEYRKEIKKDGAEVYIGIYQNIDPEKLNNYRKEIYLLESEDSLVNYSYKSLVNYFYNSVIFKLSKKDRYIFKKEPNGTTCSQISAKLSIDHFGVDFGKPYYYVYPCEIAMYGGIVIKKLIF
jgi:hypothetical protein